MKARSNRQRLRLETLEAREVPAFLGELDPTFGTGGIATVPAQINQPLTQDIVVDALGRTVILVNFRDLIVTRVNANGTSDLSFGTNGTADIDFGTFTGAAGVAVDALGNIVAVGQRVQSHADGSYTSDLVVARLTANGTLDPAFGTGGKVVIPAPAGYDAFRAGDVTFDAAGNIVVVGSLTTVGGRSAIAALRLTPIGSADPTFNGGAIQVVTALEGGYAQAVTVDPAGRIVIAGESGGPASLFAAVRLTPDGAFDPSFAGTGYTSFSLTPAGNDIAVAVAADASGNVYLGGADLSVGVIVKLTAGRLDPTFGAGGVFFSPLPRGPGPFDPVRGVSVRPNGGVVAIATSGAYQPDSDIAVFQLTSGGRLDPAFNAAGPTPGANVIDFGGHTFDRAIGVGFTPTGDVIAAGFSVQPQRLGIVRLIGTGPATPLPPRVPPVPPVRLAAPINPFASLGVTVRTATGDVNGDGFPDTIFDTGPGTPLRVAVVSGADNTTVLVAPFDPFGGNFTGGGYVAAGDFDGDGRDEFVVTPDNGGGPRVSIFSLLPGGVTTRANFLTNDPDFRGGGHIAIGDVNADGTPDLAFAAGLSGGPRVTLIDGKKVLTTDGFNPADRLVNDFFAFEAGLRNGVYLAIGDVDGDGFGDLIVGAGAGGGPRVLTVSGKALLQQGSVAAFAAPLSNFFVAGMDSDRGGVRVSVTNSDLDTKADVMVSAGEGQSIHNRLYLGTNYGGAEPTVFQELDSPVYHHSEPVEAPAVP